MKIDIDNNLINIGSLLVSDFCVLAVSGEQKKVEEFLQGQLTSDISLICNQYPQLSSICDHKGQVIADFFIYRQNNEFFIIINKNLINVFIDELNVFAKFSSVEFKKLDKKVIGEISEIDTSKGCYLKNDRFQLNVYTIESSLNFESTLNINQWNAANKILGVFFLAVKDSFKFRPIEINFDKQRVSFEKGCYRGQEIVARMEYLGLNRRKFCTFISKESFNDHPSIKIIGETVVLNNSKIFNGIVKRKDLAEIENTQEIISII